MEKTTVVQYIAFFLLFLVVESFIIHFFSISSVFFVHQEFRYLAEFLLVGLIVVILPSVRRHVVSLIALSVLKDFTTYLWILAFLLFLYISREVIFHYELLVDQRFLFLYKYSDIQGSPIYLFSVIVLVAIYEEVIFRGMIQHWLTKKVGSIAAILITSVLFGWIHGDYELFGMMMGIAFGFIYHLKRSLSAAILLHMLWNLISSLSM